jgi:hypothetical protein
MKEPTNCAITVRVVEDPEPERRSARIAELLAIGIARRLRARAAVDFGRDMSVHHDEGTEHRPWSP